VDRADRRSQKEPSTAVTDPADPPLLAELQDRFPLDVAPFAVIGERLGLSEADVIGRVTSLRDAGILRQVTPIFEAPALGYRSCLVAANVPPERLDNAVAAINAHPGVTHNYKRDHAFNLWFTIAVPPGSDLERHIATLSDVAGAAGTLPLPSVRVFKIGVSLDVSGERALTHRDASRARPTHQPAAAATLTAHEIDVIRAVQGDLPLEPRPFTKAAVSLGTTDDVIVRDLEHLHETGRLRRIAGILRHRAAGFSANGMGVWDVPDDRIDEVGTSMASYSAISHCYQRPRNDGWPYNLFTMIHARSREACDAFVHELAEAHGIARFEVLYSSTEYKKTRPLYFSPEIERWAREHGIVYDAIG